MKVVIPGGSGFLGGCLATWFIERGWEVVLLSRRALDRSDTARRVLWDGTTSGAWVAELEDADAVINLAGRSVNCRYNARNRAQILDSRVRSTEVLGSAIAQCARPPRVWLNSSTATIYRDARDRPMDEATGEIGTGFSVGIAQSWERAFFDAPTPQTRRVALRSAMVMGPQRGGPFIVFRMLARCGLGGRMGPGDQFVSWIHDRDFCRAVEWLISDENISGAVNVASPNPLPNADFMSVLRRACRMPLGLPATRWMLEIGAFFLQTETELPLKSRRVVPGRLVEGGFRFQFSHWAEAARDLVSRSDAPPRS